jgi:hypothetical protein
MEHEENYASNAKANAALTTGIIGTSGVGLALLNGLGSILGGGAVRPPEGHYVSKYELGLNQEIAAKDSKIALLESNIYVDSKIADVYERLNAKIGALEGQICQQSVINAQVTANLACMQGNINTLMALTDTVVPISRICPTPAVATTTT